MVKMCELSVYRRKAMVDDMSKIMHDQYMVDQESIDEFWQTVVIGIQAREIS